ncbi:hypothetical protein [Desertivirga brevis]|uniref:hypothetical protein n=1 Tax=Desertivirga brevis TaxID=2810310 RepID=UPI001A957243|nr:hypothetical protein [Pedobacter sp. SYSU D00873]
MTTTIEDKELNRELMELTLIGKNWLSELDLLEKDIQDLRRSYVKCLSRSSEADNYKGADEVLFLFERVSAILDAVRIDAQSYLAFIATLIEQPDTLYDLSLVENHFRIEVKLKDLLRAFNAVKQMAGKINTINSDCD